MRNELRAVVLPVETSCAAARVRVTAAGAWAQGTRVSTSEMWMRAWSPTLLPATPTGEVAGHIGSGLGRIPSLFQQRRALSTTTLSNVDSKQYVVNDDTPGVRSWSPPI